MEDADICDFATAIVEFDGESGYAIVSIDADASARGPTDTTQLRGAVAALVNEADDSEVARLAAAATAESPDDLDERFWGHGPDSVTAVKAVFADLSDQFAQRQQLAVFWWGGRDSNPRPTDYRSAYLDGFRCVSLMLLHNGFQSP